MPQENKKEGEKRKTADSRSNFQGKKMIRGGGTRPSSLDNVGRKSICQHNE